MGKHGNWRSGRSIGVYLRLLHLHATVKSFPAWKRYSPCWSGPFSISCVASVQKLAPPHPPTPTHTHPHTLIPFLINVSGVVVRRLCLSRTLAAVWRSPFSAYIVIMYLWSVYCFAPPCRSLANTLCISKIDDAFFSYLMICTSSSRTALSLWSGQCK